MALAEMSTPFTRHTFVEQLQRLVLPRRSQCQGSPRTQAADCFKQVSIRTRHSQSHHRSGIDSNQRLLAFAFFDQTAMPGSPTRMQRQKVHSCHPPLCENRLYSEDFTSSLSCSHQILKVPRRLAMGGTQQIRLTAVTLPLFKGVQRRLHSLPISRLVRIEFSDSQT